MFQSRILDFFAELPFEQRYVVDDHLRIKGMHGSGVTGEILVEDFVEFLLFDVGTFAEFHGRFELHHLMEWVGSGGD